MKNILKNIIPVLAGSLLVVACAKEEYKSYLLGGTAPALTASTTAVALTPGKEKTTALTLNWTNPNYQFTTGISSHDVDYTIQFDTLATFKSKVVYTTAVALDLTKSFTVEDMNGILSGSNAMKLPVGKSYKIYCRVISSIGSANGGALNSNTVSFTATPFDPPPVVAVPDAGTLWVTGDAFASGWGNPLPAPYDASQKFTKVSNTKYELTVNMVGGGGYKLIQEQGNWNTQYRMNDGGTWEAGTFRKQNADPAFPGAPTAGSYKITVDFQAGTYTVVKQ